MVVTDLNLAGIRSLPSEADSPLVIDPDGVTSRTLALECFKTIAGWNPEIGDLPGGIKLDELAKRNTGQP